MNTNSTPTAALRKPAVLVAWYGSNENAGTIGDLLSVRAVTQYLVNAGCDVAHATSRPFSGIAGHAVQWRDVSPDTVDMFIFVCGPLLRHHPRTQAIFEKFRGCKSIAVSVSILPRDHFNYFNNFDYALAREGMKPTYADVAIAAPLLPKSRSLSKRATPSIGLALRGFQDEYGADVCLSERMGNIIERALDIIGSHQEIRIVPIEHHLERAGCPPDEIEGCYRNCDIVVTTRFHGAILALRNLVPFIAIDQIKGGAKVSNLVSETGWPHVYNTDSIDSTSLANNILSLLASNSIDQLNDIRTRTVARAQETLDRLLSLLKDLEQER